jgi:signal-transduction protein with cAMP-binding, CBS, and nucleotidyltransferase domain
VADNRLFQRMMADNALRHRPPVGRFREFVLERKGSDKATLDLKVQGLTPFVDGARLLALAHGVEANNTLERLRQLVTLGVIERAGRRGLRRGVSLHSANPHAAAPVANAGKPPVLQPGRPRQPQPAGPTHPA